MGATGNAKGNETKNYLNFERLYNKIDNIKKNLAVLLEMLL